MASAVGEAEDEKAAKILRFLVEDSIKLSMNGNIVLIGFMGAKKSSLGYWLAKRLGVSFVDTQAYIEDRTNRIISTLSPMERPYNAIERERGIIETIANYSGFVVACDMKIAADEYSMTKIKNSGFVVWMDCGMDTAMERASGRYPLNAMNPAQREQYYRHYEEIFRHYADMVFNTSGDEDHYSLHIMLHQLHYQLYNELQKRREAHGRRRQSGFRWA